MKNIFIITTALFIAVNSNAEIKNCQDAEKAMQPQSEACNKITDNAARDKCMVDIAHKMGISEAIIQQCSKGNNQGSNNGPQGNKQGPNNGPQMSPQQCSAMIPTVRASAEKCLAIKDGGQRSACFDQIGKTIPNSCDASLNSLKQEYQNKEKAKYGTTSIH